MTDLEKTQKVVDDWILVEYLGDPTSHSKAILESVDLPESITREDVEHCLAKRYEFLRKPENWLPT